jgi:hypothetical protein
MAALPIPAIGEKRGKHAVYSIEECSTCNVKTKRLFRMQDFVFKAEGECPKCKNKTIISMIYSEPVKPS